MEVVGIIGMTLLLTLVPIEGRAITLSEYGVSAARIGRSVAWAVGGFFASIPLVFIGMKLGLLIQSISPRPSHPVSQMLEDHHNIPLVITVFLAASIQAPIFEELLFRGKHIASRFPWRFPNSPYRIVLAIGQF